MLTRLGSFISSHLQFKPLFIIAEAFLLFLQMNEKNTHLERLILVCQAVSPLGISSGAIKENDISASS